LLVGFVADFFSLIQLSRFSAEVLLNALSDECLLVIEDKPEKVETSAVLVASVLRDWKDLLVSFQREL
jgi:hypothetical protein